MKFTIKHALVVAICALCVCVVATGTVVAVSSSGNQAYARATQMIRTELIGSTRPTGNGYLGHRDRNNTMTPLATHGNPLEFTLHDQLRFDFLNPGYAVWELRYIAGTHAARVLWRNSWNEMADSSNMRGVFHPVRRNTYPFDLRTLDVVNPFPTTWLSTITIQIQWRAVANMEAPRHQVNMVQVTRVWDGNAQTALNRNTGWHEFSGPSSAVLAGRSFRGWGLNPTGPLLFPVGLPVPIFSDTRLYAILV